MKNNKTIFLFPILYAICITIAGHIISHVYKVKYGEPEYIKRLLPVLIVIVVIAIICFYWQRKTLELTWKNNGKYILYFLYTIPLAGAILYFWSIKGGLSLEFFIPLVATLFIGVGEELVSRRVLFIGLLKENNFWRALFISSVVFGILHGFNIFSGMPLRQALMQVGMTSLAGLFLALMYDYTKNFYLVAFQHWLWDYLLLSGAAKESNVIGLMVIAMMIIQIVLAIRKILQYKGGIKNYKVKF